MTTRSTAVTGLGYAVASAAAFGLSGPMAKALMGAGWSPGATVLVRVGGAALVLAPPAVAELRRRPRLSARTLRTLLVFGLVSVAGVQLAFFSAMQTLDVAVALLLEYLGTVLVVGYVWARTRVRPSAAVGIGVGVALVGLVLVLDLTGASVPNPVGVCFGLVAAVGLATYFVITGEAGDELPPLVLAAGGLAVGAVALGLAGVLGVVPLTFSTHDAGVGGAVLPFWAPMAVLILVPTVLAYVTGAAASWRLGPRLASVVGLVEVLFAVLASWLLLDEWPGPMQAVGGALIVTGVIVIRRHEAAPGPGASDLPADQLAAMGR